MHVLNYHTLATITNGKMYSNSYKNNKFKLSRRTWDKEFELPDGGSVRSMILYQIFKFILGISSRIMRR